MTSRRPSGPARHSARPTPRHAHRSGGSGSAGTVVAAGVVLALGATGVVLLHSDRADVPLAQSSAAGAPVAPASVDPAPVDVSPEVVPVAETPAAASVPAPVAAQDLPPSPRATAPVAGPRTGSWSVGEVAVPAGVPVVVRAPAAAAPAVQAPVAPPAVVPVAETPVAETPVAETPVTETPVVEVPVVGTPPVEEPVVAPVGPAYAPSALTSPPTVAAAEPDPAPVVLAQGLGIWVPAAAALIEVLPAGEAPTPLPGSAPAGVTVSVPVTSGGVTAPVVAEQDPRPVPRHRVG